MGDTHRPPPVLPLAAVFSRHPRAMDWALQRLTRHYGPVAMSSDRFPFDQTRYYEAEMGPGLLKQFHLLATPADPQQLADWKLASNQWEQELAAGREFPQPRPLNIDPGYLTAAKLVLATTKDRDHRIYLRDGIYAEVTLFYRQGQWQTRPWTYPDYAEPRLHEFLDRCREHLRGLEAEMDERG